MVSDYQQRDEPPQKMSKLAIAAETEEDRFETHTRVVCYECKPEEVDKSLGKVRSSAVGNRKALTRTLWASCRRSLMVF